MNKEQFGTNEKIDFVVAWVDGSDPDWIAERNKYDEKKDIKFQDDRDCRYRPWDSLRYLFRGIEKFAPWVNKVYFVTWGHTPIWLNKECENLIIVRHDEFIPDKYLPTFNAAPIEFNLHRIKGLSEHFVYFNDDMFLIRPTLMTDFFKKGKPCDAAVLNAFCADRIYGTNKVYLKPVLDTLIVNSHYNKKKSMRSCPTNWYNLKYGTNLLRTLTLTPWRHFTGFINWHFPYSLCKDTLCQLWELEHDVLDETCKHKFRKGDDINIWTATYWQYAQNNFHPRNPRIGMCTSMIDDLDENRRILNNLSSKKYKFVCINDDVNDRGNIEETEKILKNFFDKILPEKSKFEVTVQQVKKCIK